MRARLAGLALLAVLLIAGLSLPARVLVPFLDLPDGLGQVQGTVWSGSARWRQPGQQPLDVRWGWQSGREWRWQALDGATDLQGRWRPGRGLDLPAVRGWLALDRLDLSDWLIVARPVGILELDLDEVELSPGQVPQAMGRAVWRQAGLVGAIQESLGDIELLIAPGTDALVLDIRSLQSAPIQVRGRIDVGAQRYQVDLWLRADRERPDLQRALRDLGEVQPDGQVRLRLSGRSGL